MADLTLEAPLATAWVNIDTALGLLDGTTYLVDVHSINNGADAYWAETDDANPPTVIGHPLKPNERGAAVDSRELTPESGKNTWMRVTVGTAVVVATPV